MQRTDDEGFVYILSNPAYKNNFVKIGKSSASPLRARASELFTTGVPTPFSVEYHCKAKDYHNLEKRVHKYLQKERVNKNREFFEITIDRAIFVIQELGKNDILHEEIVAEKRKEIEKLLEQQRLVDTRHKEINEFTKNLSQELQDLCNNHLNQREKLNKTEPYIFWIFGSLLVTIPLYLITVIGVAGLIPIALSIIIAVIWAILLNNKNNEFNQKIRNVQNKFNQKLELYCNTLNDGLINSVGDKWDKDKEHYKKNNSTIAHDYFKKFRDALIEKQQL